ncbi:alpha/beta fold hydrolase [Lentzea sp. NBRC 102530]|uniref:thioesterase II family protein n=1 Tax=Lentzea sp. NBRC 102530 TaxID=3032201 RepID=UPI00249FE8C0|nr:alpha/beta fold hydrolase [Lentzea sp. NBRC 102530]GLY51439.1 oleoyl-ACP hydrolase [Lentzea sp. NBRC 102530]
MMGDWFDSHDGEGLRLYCFPYVGGNESLFHDWTPRLRLQVVPVLLPGRGRRADEPALTSADDIAVPLARQIAAHSHRKPGIALFGHSMGALLAYVTAVVLERDHGLPPVRLFVSAAGAPHRPPRLKPVRMLPDDELLDEVLAVGGTPEAVRHDAEALRHAVPTLRADATVVETYRHGGYVLSCPVTVFLGRDDSVVSVDSARRWSELTTRPAVIHTLPGDHFFVRDPLVSDMVQMELKENEPR